MSRYAHWHTDFADWGGRYGWRIVLVPELPRPVVPTDRTHPGGNAMKARMTTCVLLLSVVPGLAMAATPAPKVSEIAGATGLTERQVKMVFGGHTAYAE